MSGIFNAGRLAALLLAALATALPAAADEIPGRVVHAPGDIPALYRVPAEHWPAPWVDEGVDWVELGRLPPVPGGTAWTEKTRLGRELFFEPALSASGQQACASCHDPDHAWTDGRRVPFGHNRTPGTRNTLSLLNVVYLDTFFWDGRASSLQDQVEGPLTHPMEMNHTPTGAVAALRAIPRYLARFRDAFGDNRIDYARITEALADFERTLTSRPSRFDAFVDGRHQALSDEEIRGLHWFRTQGGCMNCHSGPLLTDQQFHNIGVQFYGRPIPDPGRALVTGRDEDWGAFRTPPLRDVAHTGPYMHTGFLPGLENVIAFYNKGGAQAPEPPEGSDEPRREISPLIRPLELDAGQQRDIIAFLHAISTRPNRLPLAFERELRGWATAKDGEEEGAIGGGYGISP